MGIEPTLPAWKAGALPLSYTREVVLLYTKKTHKSSFFGIKGVQSVRDTFESPASMADGILFFHGHFRHSLPFFRHKKQRIIAKTVRPPIFGEDFSVHAAFAEKIAAVGQSKA